MYMILLSRTLCVPAKTSRDPAKQFILLFQGAASPAQRGHHLASPALAFYVSTIRNNVALLERGEAAQLVAEKRACAAGVRMTQATWELQAGAAGDLHTTPVMRHVHGL